MLLLIIYLLGNFGGNLLRFFFSFFFFMFLFILGRWSGKSVCLRDLIIIDNTGFLICFLSFLIMSMRVLVNLNKRQGKYDIFLFNILLLNLFICFIFFDFFFFFILFEFSLLIILIKILGRGYQVDRVSSGIYIVLYTLLGTLPLLLFIIFINYHGFTNISFYLYRWNLVSNRIYFDVIIIIGFLIKFPMFGFHLWLPKAHVEASTFGRILLAGILLKLGGYGLFRFEIFLSNFIYSFWGPLVRFILCGSVFLSFYCLRLIDAKYLVACSSVVHIRICILGLYLLNSDGYWGCIIIIFGHGMCSCGLFYLCDIIYHSIKSRRLWLINGITQFIPGVIFFTFFMCVCNISVPPRINLVGEIYIMVGSYRMRCYYIFFLFVISIRCCLYSIWLYSLLSHGKNNIYYVLFKRPYLVNYYVLVVFLVIIFIITLFISDFYII